VFVDFAKAFDHVDHNILVTKLVAMGLPDVIVRWMCAFLRDRRQRVKTGDVFFRLVAADGGDAAGVVSRLEHSNSGQKISILFDSAI